jgi:spoIIIJ-associated protein
MSQDQISKPAQENIAEKSEPDGLYDQEHIERDSDDEYVLAIARDTVVELLDKMKIEASVSARYLQDDSDSRRKPILVDIHGDDLSILIGRKAETLNALQYITSLILGKELGRSVPLSVDVEGYRSRRQQQLKQLAHRIAEQVIETGRSQALEPMPANERRLIHIELRDHPEVYTESTGDGNYRKVVVYYKNEN